MIHEELTLSPFERAHFGRRNEFVFRRHESLPDDLLVKLEVAYDRNRQRFAQAEEPAK